MSFFAPFEAYQLVLGALLAAGWGVACSVFERMALAPNRKLSASGPAYIPAMLLSLFAGGIFATSEGPSLLFALLMAGIFFALGFVPALVSFHFARWMLRTRFSDN
jgi:hypothetical protein